MMTKLRNAAKTAAERRDARRLYRSTAHLDARLLKDMGFTRDDWNRVSYRSM